MIRMSRKTNKNISSIFNALAAICLTLVNGLLGIIVTRMVIAHYGSDFNGLNSTVNQITNILLILEGGFTLASNVALFAPIAKNDWELINYILNVTYKKFHKIGAVFCIVGILVTLAYTCLVRTTLPNELVITIMLMAIIPAAFNLYYAATYRVLLQSSQKEYIISIITIVTIGLGHVINIAVIHYGGHMWCIRLTTMLFSFLNSILIMLYVVKHYPIKLTSTISDNILIDNSYAIKGTNDVMAQKITGVIYNAAPIVFLSLAPSGGTIMASIYMVYNSIFLMLKSMLMGLIDAPRFSIGQMLIERNREDVWKIFRLYEYIVFCAIFISINTTYALIMPFITLYTDGVSDANYYMPMIAVIMALTTSIEMMHIPSGHLINMAGNFKIAKNIQIFSCAILIFSMTLGGIYCGIYGMLLAVLFTALFLAVMEMGYIHCHYFHNKTCSLFRMIIPLIVVSVPLCILEQKMTKATNTAFLFVFYGALLLIVNFMIALCLSLFFCKQECRNIWTRCHTLIDKLSVHR